MPCPGPIWTLEGKYILKYLLSLGSWSYDSVKNLGYSWLGGISFVSFHHKA